MSKTCPYCEQAQMVQKKYNNKYDCLVCEKCGIVVVLDEVKKNEH